MSGHRELSGSRLEVALVLNGGDKTANEVGKALGRPTGSVFGMLKRMHAERLLTATPSPPSRGTRYGLTPALEAMLREAGARPAEPGRLRRHQVVVAVEQPPDPVGVAEVFSDGAYAGIIEWVAEAAGGYLLGLRVAETHFPVQRLVAALSAKGASARQIHLTDVISGLEFRERQQWLLDDVRRLP